MQTSNILELEKELDKYDHPTLASWWTTPNTFNWPAELKQFENKITPIDIMFRIEIELAKRSVCVTGIKIA